MTPRPFFTKLWLLFLEMLLFGVASHIFFAYLQDNVYGSTNSLIAIEKMMSNQVSATSFSVVLYMSSAWMLLCVGIAEYLKVLEKPIGIVGLYIAPLVPLIVYIYYEINQMLQPTYVDNHILDIIMSVLACTTLWVVNTYAIKSVKR